MSGLPGPAAFPCGRAGQAGGTLAERKAGIGVLQGQIDAHKLDCCACSRRSLCDERRQLDAELGQAQADVRGWFGPSPDDPQLDLG